MKNKNKMKKIIYIIILFFISSKVYSSDQFIFDITEIQIIDDGNKFIGTKRGTAKSEDGIIINANRFEYDKNLNILNANGDVKIEDTINKFLIYTDEIIYDKNKDIINTKNNSKGISLNDNIVITAKNFEYKKSSNLLSAYQNVVLTDEVNDYKIFADFISYKKKRRRNFNQRKNYCCC